jgi:hypothetical protein
MPRCLVKGSSTLESLLISIILHRELCPWRIANQHCAYVKKDSCTFVNWKIGMGAAGFCDLHVWIISYILCWLLSCVTILLVTHSAPQFSLLGQELPLFSIDCVGVSLFLSFPLHWYACCWIWNLYNIVIGSSLNSVQVVFDWL